MRSETLGVWKTLNLGAVTKARHGPAHSSLLVLSGQCSLQCSVSIEVLMSPRAHGSPKPSPMSSVHSNNCLDTVGLRIRRYLLCTLSRLTMHLSWHHSPVHLHTTLTSVPLLWHCQAWSPFTHILDHTAASTFIQKTDRHLRWRTQYIKMWNWFLSRDNKES